jgi:hypothetical protein
MIFLRALERGNLIVAEATAREVGQISLAEALELTALIARKEPHRHSRVAARWLRRYLAEQDSVALEEVGLIVGCLTALRSSHHEVALAVLRGMTRSRRRPVG